MIYVILTLFFIYFFTDLDHLRVAPDLPVKYVNVNRRQSETKETFPDLLTGRFFGDLADKKPFFT